MKRFIALLLTLVLAIGAVSVLACGPAEQKPQTTPTPGGETTDAPASDLKIGVILIGDENEGYTYAHIEGVEAALKANGLSKSNVIYKYNVPENETCYETAIDLVEQGCKIIFANSFGHEDHMFRAAKEHPEVLFCHATGQKAAKTAKEQNLSNVFNYFTSIYEARYVSGVVAGMKLKQLMDEGKVTEPHVGYVGAFPYAEVVSGYTAFLLGIRSIVPDAYMDVQYTNKWFDITGEAEAANMLIARGCVIIGQHADSTGAPSAVEAKLKEGVEVYSVGYNVDMLSVAPTAALTSSQNNWGAYYTYAVKTVLEGGQMKQDWCGGYAVDAVQISALGESCAPGTKEAVDKVIEDIKGGKLHVFDCNNFTVGGNKLDSYDQSYGFEGTQLIWDGYFHESEVISAPLFDIRIDGINELNK